MHILEHYLFFHITWFAKTYLFKYVNADDLIIKPEQNFHVKMLILCDRLSSHKD